MQRSFRSLTFIVPGIAAPLGEAIATGDARWPVLARFASRGTLRTSLGDREAGLSALRPWQASLLEALSLDASASDYPSAAVSRAGAVQSVSEECWAHVHAVHFAAGLNDLTGMLLNGAAELTSEERSSLTPTLNDHLHADGYELFACERGGEWLLRCPRPIEARTVPPESAFVGELKNSMPQGQNATELRRLMTELQMLLHEHPVNAARIRRGLPEANAGWIWGVGSIASRRAGSGRMLPVAYGTESYLKGVYLLHDTPVRAQRFDADTLCAVDQEQGAVLAVAELQNMDTLEAQWLTPVSRALRRGTFDTLSLHLDRWCITVRRGDLLRFWRRSVSPARWRA